MATPATMSGTVGSICLTKMSIPAHSEAIASGWGGIDEVPTQSTVLKQVLHPECVYDHTLEATDSLGHNFLCSS